MNKILKVLLGVVAMILVLKFITSSFFIWMVVAVAVPQLLKLLAKKEILPEFQLGHNAYRYTTIAVVVFTVLGIIFKGHWVTYMISSLIGVALSYLMFEDIGKK